jgi:acetate kinase
MKVLVVNAGSSSLKYQLIEMDNESVLAKGNCDRIGIDGHISHKTGDGRSVEQDYSFPTHTEAFEKLVEVLTKGDASVISDMGEISAVGHRIVQGAEIFDKTTLVTDEVFQKIDDLQELAPVHNHPHALALWACKKVMPENVPQAVVFDTAFHQTIPQKAFMFGLPYEDYEKYSIRKYGFHGTSHRFVSSALAAAMGKDVKDLKIISCHLGNGSSITAVNGGKSVDTSMGFTPLDGVIMGTRCGCIDASAVTYLADKHGFTPKETSDYLNKKSGFLGISGVSSDNRELSKAVSEGNKRAALATDMLIYGIKKYIGSYIAVMNGCDAILFTGGIGENACDIRAKVLSDLQCFGIELNPQANEQRGQLTKISADSSKIQCWVVPTNEELLIARDTLALIG